jgi:hypothetical protein
MPPRYLGLGAQWRLLEIGDGDNSTDGLATRKIDATFKRSIRVLTAESPLL